MRTAARMQYRPALGTPLKDLALQVSEEFDEEEVLRASHVAAARVDERARRALRRVRALLELLSAEHVAVAAVWRGHATPRAVRHAAGARAVGLPPLRVVVRVSQAVHAAEEAARGQRRICRRDALPIADLSVEHAAALRHSARLRALRDGRPPAAFDTAKPLSGLRSRRRLCVRRAAVCLLQEGAS
eukprot:307049-Pleurochrysis_carterae.AAC.3